MDDRRDRTASRSGGFVEVCRVRWRLPQAMRFAVTVLPPTLMRAVPRAGSTAPHQSWCSPERSMFCSKRAPEGPVHTLFRWSGPRHGPPEPDGRVRGAHEYPRVQGARATGGRGAVTTAERAPPRNGRLAVAHQVGRAADRSTPPPASTSRGRRRAGSAASTSTPRRWPCSLASVKGATTSPASLASTWAPTVPVQPRARLFATDTAGPRHPAYRAPQGSPRCRGQTSRHDRSRRGSPRLFSTSRPARPAGKTGPAPRGGSSYREIGARLGRSERWAT